jgi:poly(A) polymerase
LLDESGLLRVLLPEVAALQGVTQPPEFHPEGDVWVHTLAMLEGFDETVRAMPAVLPRGLRGDADERAVLGWAVLLHDVGKPGTRVEGERICFHGHDALGVDLAERILTRLRRPGKLIRPVLALIGGHMRFVHLSGMREAKRRRTVQDELFPLHLELHRLDCLGSHRKLDAYQYAVAALEREERRPPLREPLLRGTDLIAVGYRPGPQMGCMLKAVEDARLEGTVLSRDEALAWVAREFPGE